MVGLSNFSLAARARLILSAIETLGGTTDPLTVAPPASTDEILAVEAQLGIKLPASLRNAFLAVSSGMDCFWQLPDNWLMPTALRKIFGGSCNFALNRIVELEKIRLGWIEVVFPDPSHPYDAIWHNKLAFQDVGNGDMLAIDITPGSSEEVVYLSHEDGEGHGRRLGADFTDFLARWSQIGFVGAEDWQMLPFAPDGGYIDPHCDAANLFKREIRLENK